MIPLIKSLGWIVARAPEPLLAALAALLGNLIFGCLRGRRRLILSNLHHAFPDRTEEWRRRVGRESCRRLVETGLLSLATPFLPEARLRRIIRGSPSLVAAFAAHRESPRASLICSPHLAYWEAQTCLPLLVPPPFPEFGTIYRPLDNAAADAWVRRARERFGLRLLSRKQGFAEALKILRRRGFVGVLFDQNAGMQGALTLLLGRVCSTTELPGLMAARFDARVFGIYPRRLGFWRLEIGLDEVAAGGPGDEVTLALNRWLERLLSGDDDLCASWLWAHDRWRHQDVPAQRLRLESRRNLLALDTRERGLSAPPRGTRFWVRLPNWLGDVIMLLPLLRALRVSRPDASITLVGRPQFAPLLARWAVADAYHPLPPRGAGYFAHFRRLRDAHIDVFLIFTHSVRGDLEAWLSGARQRFGIVREGRRRPLLSGRFAPGTRDGLTGDVENRRQHQFESWELFLRHFGLEGPVDRSPLRSEAALPQRVIGLIAGSENNPEKRWPVSHWRALIEALPDERFVLFGTAGDRPIAAAVAAGFPPDRVRDLAGHTDLAGLVDRLQECALVVANDTGGMHLANAFGVPLVALFGPTNPQRTAPVFDSPVKILQPPGSPPTGGASLSSLSPATVIAAVKSDLPPPAPRLQPAFPLPPD